MAGETYREDILCIHCDTEFFIEYSDSKLTFCPFCGEEIKDQYEDDDYEEWD